MTTPAPEPEARLGTCDSSDTPHVQAYWEDLQPAVGLEGSGFTEGHYCTNWKPTPQPPVVSGGERLMIECELTDVKARSLTLDTRDSAALLDGMLAPGRLIRRGFNMYWRVTAIHRMPAASESAPEAGVRQALIDLLEAIDRPNSDYYNSDYIEYEKLGPEMKAARRALAVPAPAAERMTEADGGFVRWCAECGQHRPLSHKHPVPAEPGGGSDDEPTMKLIHRERSR